jgi:hypothetical protein
MQAKPASSKVLLLFMMTAMCVCLCQGRGTARPDTKGIFFAEVCHHPCAAAGDMLNCCGTLANSYWQLGTFIHEPANKQQLC